MAAHSTYCFHRVTDAAGGVKVGRVAKGDEGPKLLGCPGLVMMGRMYAAGFVCRRRFLPEQPGDDTRQALLRAVAGLMTFIFHGFGFYSNVEPQSRMSCKNHPVGISVPAPLLNANR